LYVSTFRRIRWIAVLLCVPTLGRSAVAHPVYAQTFAVAVLDNSYNPEPFTIAPGTTVIWTNRGQVPHTVTSDDPAVEAFDSGTLLPGKSFSHTFNHAGVFTYHCSFHDNMLGTIIVGDTPPAEATATPAPTVSDVPTRPASKSTAARRVAIRIVGAGRMSRFEPKILKIWVGTLVTWKNSTAVLQTVTSRTRGWAFKQSLPKKKTVSFTFQKTGKYRYSCGLQPGMVGTIVVHR
jgi:plastocyanin